jgi:nitroreductase
MVLKEIEERFSVRAFADKKIPDEVLKEILEAGRLAPSWVNTQPWHFLVVKSQQNKALLSQVALGQPHVEKADAIIVICGDKSAMDTESFRKILSSRPSITEDRINLLVNNDGFNPSLKGNSALNLRVLEEVTYATAYMTLEAQRHGVGTCVVGFIANALTGAAPEVYQLARKTFNLPESVEIMSLLILGYPDESAEKQPKIRKSFDEVVSYETYGW